MILDRRNNWRWARRHIGPQRYAPFHYRPAAVAAADNPMHHLPRFPAVVGGENLVCLWINAELPRIAQTIRPDFWSGARRVHKRIVSRNAVRLIADCAIDVDPQNRAEQI